jgi:hypothetical protein
LPEHPQLSIEQRGEYPRAPRMPVPCCRQLISHRCTWSSDQVQLFLGQPGDGTVADHREVTRARRGRALVGKPPAAEPASAFRHLIPLLPCPVLLWTAQSPTICSARSQSAAVPDRPPRHARTRRRCPPQRTSDQRLRAGPVPRPFTTERPLPSLRMLPVP